MAERLERRRFEDEGGFTLIELMVVVLIIGILIAIALPTFLGARERAQNRAAQSNLRNGIAAAKTYFTDGDTYTGFDATAGTSIEPSLSWAAAGDPGTNYDAVVISEVDTTGDDAVTLVARSASGAYFCIADASYDGAESTRGGTFTDEGTTYASVDALDECNDGNPWDA